MALPIDRVPALPGPSPSGPAASARPGQSFAEVLRSAPDPAGRPVLPERWRELAASISSGERTVDRVIAQAAAGRDFSPAELIAIQARVYRYTQELELVSKVVDKACQGLRQTLQTQV